MLIKYNGPKPQKMVERNTIDQGVLTFYFRPPAMATEIKHPEVLRFLLHQDRHGLFSIVKECDLKKAEEKIEEALEKPKPKRGRKKKVENGPSDSGSTDVS